MNLMDLNDINNRLQRVYKSINATYSENIGSFTNINVKKDDDNGTVISGSFNQGDSIENQINIMNVIHNIANLKDNIKSKIREIDKDEKLVEEEINNSLSLQLITDLSNQDKHGYPLTKSNRSNKNPLICNISTALVKPNKVHGNETGSIIFDLENNLATYHGSLKIGIYAEIYDDSNNFICTFKIMVENAITTWENFLKTHNIT